MYDGGLDLGRTPVGYLVSNDVEWGPLDFGGEQRMTTVESHKRVGTKAESGYAVRESGPPTRPPK